MFAIVDDKEVVAEGHRWRGKFVRTRHDEGLTRGARRRVGFDTIGREGARRVRRRGASRFDRVLHLYSFCVSEIFYSSYSRHYTVELGGGESSRALSRSLRPVRACVRASARPDSMLDTVSCMRASS